MARKRSKHRKAHRRPKKAKLSRKVRKWVSRKIRFLIHEGRSRMQAIAMAYRMAGVARPKKGKRKAGR